MSEPSSSEPTGHDQAGKTARRQTRGKKKTDAAAEPAMTPMMAQFTEIKAANPDSLLFYRMGDFYELFFDDAVVASQALGITLTKRGKHLGEDVAMCGVPVHAADGYLQRLIRLGFRVAVCEQTEDPAEAKKRGAKSVVRRDVIRLVTPGTLTEDTLLQAQSHNFLTACFAGRSEKGGGQRAGLASVDISTGEFIVGDVAMADLAGELARLLPSEVLLPDSTEAGSVFEVAVETIGAARTPVPSAYFRSNAGERDLKARLAVADLTAYGEFSRRELAAVGALLKYIDLTQIGKKPLLRAPKRAGPTTVMAIDAATRANLELVRTALGERQTSLLHAMDRTVTGAGARELATRIASPLLDPQVIAGRLDAVSYFLDARSLRETLRGALREAPDLARAMSRLSLGRGGPRDLGSVQAGLTVAQTCGRMLSEARPNGGLQGGLPGELKRAGDRLRQEAVALKPELDAALADELPVHRRDGGFVRAGYRDDLDENLALRDESRRILTDLQTRYQVETGVKSLKVRHNNVLGYFVEVTAGNAGALQGEPHGEVFRHRQTLVNAMRFSTAELSETEGRITAAADRALAIEQEVFNDLAGRVANVVTGLTSIAEALAELDVHAGLAELAEAENYARPVVDMSDTFELIGARHPVVEQALRAADGAAFIENDCVLCRPRAPRREPMPDGNYKQDSTSSGGALSGFDEHAEARIWVVTGPNMAGKSTFLRQNALIAVMAQMGSFVPARSAHIGVIDRLFSRVGASDDLARGRSTFMVEMVETAGILNLATERSLVILDEIGRGTATFDGLSIAWATIEYLHDVNRCRALFATHYHELTALASRLAMSDNVTIAVKEWKDEIVFLHKVVPGAADRSYGIQVAKLAGLPGPVISRAGEVLRLLEENDRNASPESLIDDLPLFAASRPESGGGAGAGDDAATNSVLAELVADLNPDEMSPRDALAKLYQLKDAHESDRDDGP